jgi:hypothetical protein
MTTTKTILIAATGAAVTLALLLLVINLGDNPPGAVGERLVILLLPAEIIGETFGTRASFLIAGFLEFFLIYMLGLLCWKWVRARKRTEDPTIQAPEATP